MSGSEEKADFVTYTQSLLVGACLVSLSGDTALSSLKERKTRRKQHFNKKWTSLKFEVGGRWEWDDKIEGYEKNRWGRWEWRRFRKKFVDKKVNYFNEKINEIKIKMFEILVSDWESSTYYCSEIISSFKLISLFQL